jgi:hypothetical protein
MGINPWVFTQSGQFANMLKKQLHTLISLGYLIGVGYALYLAIDLRSHSISVRRTPARDGESGIFTRNCQATGKISVDGQS